MDSAGYARETGIPRGVREANVERQPARGEWRQAARCETGQCVEVKLDGDTVALRDSRGPALVFPLAAWKVFVAGVKAGDFDV